MWMWAFKGQPGVIQNLCACGNVLGKILPSRISPHNFYPTPHVQLLLRNSRCKSTQAAESAVSEGGFSDLDKPIKFTTSKAAEWKAARTHGGTVDPDMPEYQPLIVCFSIGVFLLYFLALREENDIDEDMKKPLWEKVPGLEKKQLEVVLQYNQEHGLPTQDILNRIQEIKQLSQNQGNK